MTRAFETIDRLMLLADLCNIINADSWRIIVALLDHTTLKRGSKTPSRNRS
jgi:hypothetical protein